MFEDRLKALEHKLDGIFAFADLLCRNLGEPMFIATEAKDTVNGLTTMRGHWVGDLSDRAAIQSSRAPFEKYFSNS